MDDETLVQKCLDGDTEAFGELVRRYERPLFNVALRMLRDREEARDVAGAKVGNGHPRLQRPGLGAHDDAVPLAQPERAGIGRRHEQRIA